MTDIHLTNGFEKRDKELIGIGNIRNIAQLKATDMRHRDMRHCDGYQNC